MKLWKKDPEGPNGFDPAAGGGGSAARITPHDVQEKKFRRSSRPSGGYVMREVDEFLDEITDTLSALIAENERLRRAGGSAPVDRPAAGPASSAGDRAAVDAFLQREKGFLQDLGGLVQAHAEELKSMVRSARAAAPAPAGEQPVAAAAAAPAPAEPASGTPASVPQEEAPPPAAVVEESAAAAPSAPESPSGKAADADTGVVAEQPIRLEEPEPARTGPADEQDRSLRELFWGEE